MMAEYRVLCGENFTSYTSAVPAVNHAKRLAEHGESVELEACTRHGTMRYSAQELKILTSRKLRCRIVNGIGCPDILGGDVQKGDCR